MNEQHTMVLGKTRHSGAEEWYCPTCGRSLLISWKPRFMKIVLEAGDEFAVHSGGKGDMRIAQVQVMTEENAVMEEHRETLVDEIWLAPWNEWMDEVGFERLWNE